VPRTLYYLIHTVSSCLGNDIEALACLSAIQSCVGREPTLLGQPRPMAGDYATAVGLKHVARERHVDGAGVSVGR